MDRKVDKNRLKYESELAQHESCKKDIESISQLPHHCPFSLPSLKFIFMSVLSSPLCSCYCRRRYRRRTWWNVWVRISDMHVFHFIITEHSNFRDDKFSAHVPAFFIDRHCVTFQENTEVVIVVKTNLVEFTPAEGGRRWCKLSSTMISFSKCLGAYLCRHEPDVRIKPFA